MSTNRASPSAGSAAIGSKERADVTARGGQFHRPERAVYRVRREGDDLVVSCQYWEVRHAAKHGGNITSIVFPHGSGRNIFAAPCSSQVRAGTPFASNIYDNALDERPELSVSEQDGEVRVTSHCRLRTATGDELPADCVHTFTYHRWGVIRQKLIIDLHRPITDAWNVTVARPVVAAHLDEFSYRPAWQSATDWAAISNMVTWQKLTKGGSFRDSCAVETGEVPLHLMFLQRGVEGFDWFCGENLEQWHERFAGTPHVGRFRVCYQRGLGGYEVTLCPLDIWGSRFPLEGRLEFDFFLGLPFVQERVRPLVRTVGTSNVAGPGGSLAFLRPERIAELGKHGGQLVRHHDDGQRADGVWWRDGSYPPYPPEQMRDLDGCIADLHAQGLCVTPYFSLHEYSPESPDFARIGQACGRSIHDDGRRLVNPSPGGVYGAQMCLLSEWSDILKGNIDTVLSKHAFDGLYFDWTFPMACRNPSHRSYVHWDIEAFMDMLEWSRERVGEDGILYLHMSLEPFMMAENLATCVLVYESPAPDRPERDMFPPIAEFMKTCSRVVLATEAQKADPRRYMLHCLLNHLMVDRPSDDFLAAFDELAEIDFGRYRHFASQAVCPVRTSDEQVLSAVYWNDQEALILLVNLRDDQVEVDWSLETRVLTWSGRPVAAGRARLAPLAFRYLQVDRKTV